LKSAKYGCGLNSPGLVWGPVAGCCEYGNKTWVSTKCLEFLHRLTDCSMDLLKVLPYQFSELQRFVLKCFLLERALAVSKLLLSALVLISCVPTTFSRAELKLDVCEQEIYKTVGQVDAL
jgi:hypothetical protein